MTTSAIPFFPAVRHVRLSAAHARALFGSRPVDAVYTLACGDDVSDVAVDVDVGGRRLARVRVFLPFVVDSFVALTARDLRDLGWPNALPATTNGAPGGTLHGPGGVVVLVNGVVAAERVELPPAIALTSSTADIVIEGERPRTFRRLAVARAQSTRAFVADDGEPVHGRGRLVTSTSANA